MTANRPLIVLLGPASIGNQVWDDVQKALPEQVDVYRYERLAPAPNLHIQDVANDVCTHVQAFNTSHVIGVGISLGAMILQHAALCNPDLWQGLVLGNTSFTQTETSRNALMARANEMATINNEEYVVQTISRWFSPDFQRLNKPVVDHISECITRTSRIERARDWQLASQVDTADHLQDLSLPAIVLAGSNDISTPPQRQQALAALLQADYQEIDGAGHMSCVEAPERWAKVITSLIPS